MKAIFILAMISALITLGILIAGVAGMGKQDEGGKTRGNKLMQARVAMQFVTLLLLLLAAVTA